MNRFAILRTSPVLYAFLFSALGVTSLHAQSNGAGFYGGEIGLSFQTGFPQGGFSKNVDHPGFGIGGDLLWMPSAYGIGISVNYLVYGSTSRREPFNPNVPEVTVEVTTTNSILLGHILGRLEYPSGFARPYIDALVGINYLNTSSSVKDENNTTDENIASSTNSEDVAFSYGAGGGLQFRVHEGGKDEKLSAIMIDIGVRYIFGGKAKYLTEGAITHDANGTLLMNYSKSRTDIIVAHLGVLLLF